MLFKGYVADDPIGNWIFALHVMLAAIVAFGGVVQFLPQIRARAMWLHQWNGRVFASSAIAASIGGLYLVWVRGSSANPIAALAISLNAVLILVFCVLAWRAARAGNIARHRVWALRSYIAANGVWFQRAGYFAWFLINQAPVGITKKLDGPFDLFWAFGCYLLPLSVLELYLYAKATAGTLGKLAMAVALALVSLLTTAGILGIYLFVWRKLLLL